MTYDVHVPRFSLLFHFPGIERRAIVVTATMKHLAKPRAISPQLSSDTLAKTGLRTAWCWMPQISVYPST